MKKISVLLASLFVAPLAFSSDLLEITDTKIVGIGESACPAGYELTIDADGSLYPSEGDTCTKTNFSVIGNKVGIGTASSSYGLTVNDEDANQMTLVRIKKDMAFKDGSTIGQLVFAGEDSDSERQNAASIYSNAEEYWTPTAQGSALIFATTEIGSTNTPERMRIDSSGNVGINNNNPQSKFAVSGLPTYPPDSSGNAGIVCITNDGNLWIDEYGQDCIPLPPSPGQ